MRFFRRNRLIISYGIALAALLLLLRYVEHRFIFMQHSTEIYGGIIAVIFTCVGIWAALKLAKPKTVVVEKAIYLERPENFTPDEKAIEAFGLSPRELEVLQLMSEGMSNQEIAGKLFVSLSTVKTHSSRLFEKLEVNRRTQAVEKGKKLGVI